MQGDEDEEVIKEEKPKPKTAVLRNKLRTDEVRVNLI